MNEAWHVLRIGTRVLLIIASVPLLIILSCELGKEVAAMAWRVTHGPVPPDPVDRLAPASTVADDNPAAACAYFCGKSEVKHYEARTNFALGRTCVCGMLK